MNIVNERMLDTHKFLKLLLQGVIIDWMKEYVSDCKCWKKGELLLYEEWNDLICIVFFKERWKMIVLLVDFVR